jgi:hypothetical protein
MFGFLSVFWNFTKRREDKEMKCYKNSIEERQAPKRI